MIINPREINILGVYLPSLLLAGIAGAISAYVILLIMTRFRITRYFYHVMLVYVALAVILTIIFDKIILLTL